MSEYYSSAGEEIKAEKVEREENRNTKNRTKIDDRKKNTTEESLEIKHFWVRTL